MDQSESPLFNLGQIAITPAAFRSIQEAGDTALPFLHRHVCGDWGDLDREDRCENDISVQNGFRILSAYHTSRGVKLWIITEADRSSTTILLPEEY